ncbi:MAG TPA: TetR/AcrR family transcriptional regulator [Amycolatopsis sp.]|nr:TetR/AcrR family transcriptional regulator [Amycolatopsis sp.]
MSDNRRGTPGRPTADERGGQVATAQRLLLGAAGLFREKGYAATTTRELSALAGIQNGSLYHHVGGKEDLLYKLCVAALDDVAAIFTATAAEKMEPARKLEQIARDYVVQALRDRDRHATMLSEIRALSPAHREEVIARRDENVRLVEDIVADAQRVKQIRDDIEPKYLTLALFNLLNWTIFWFDPEAELSEQGIAEILCSVFFDGANRRETGGKAGKTAKAASKPRTTKKRG